MKLWIVTLVLSLPVEEPHWVQPSVGLCTGFFLYHSQSFPGMDPWYTVWFWFPLSKLGDTLAFFIQRNIFEEPKYYPGYYLLIEDF